MLRPRPKTYRTLGVARRKWRRPRPNTSYVNWTTIHNILGRYSLNDPSPSSDLAPPPVARPVDSVVLTSDVVPVARPLSSAVVTGPPALPEEVRYVVVKRTTEPFAVASAICGMTAIVPVLSQLVGLTLGIVSLVRFRRAKRSGLELSGKGWAIAGITTSGLALIGWIGFAVVLAGLGSSVLSSSDALSSLLTTPSP